MGITSLVLGIVAIVFGFIPSVQWIGSIVAILGIILGAMAKSKPEQAGVGKAGLICSIIGLVLCLLTFIACASCVGGLAGLGAAL